MKSFLPQPDFAFAMPIYAYKCAACGFAKDVLQKMSDPPLAECPSCGQAAFEKQLTAAGFARVSRPAQLFSDFITR